jgi:antitoxin component of MazEF toxin-antitoxin module
MAQTKAEKQLAELAAALGVEEDEAVKVAVEQAHKLYVQPKG